MNEIRYCEKCKAIKELEETIDFFDKGLIKKEDIPEHIRNGLINLLKNDN